MSLLCTPIRRKVSVALIALLAFIGIYPSWQIYLYADHDAPVTPILIIQNNSKVELTVVTGASSNHLLNLIYFLETYDRHQRFSLPRRLVIYDLGMEEYEIEYLKQMHLDRLDYVFETFNYSKYPPHVNIHLNKGEYAWKPVIIHEVCEKYGNIVSWMDGGNIIKGPWEILVNTAQNNHIFTPESSGDIAKWTHPKTLQYLNYTGNKTLPNRMGGAFVVDYRLRWAQQLVKDWKDCALIKACIAPNGSSRDNHRQDQAVLTVLYYQYQSKYKFPVLNSKLNFGVNFHIDEVENRIQSDLDRFKTEFEQVVTH